MPLALAYAPPLQGMDPNQANAVVVLVGGAALYLAYASTRARSAGAGFGAALLGLALAAAAGWLLDGTTATAAVGAGAYLLVASGANLYAVGRTGETWGWGLLAVAGIAALSAAASIEVAAFAAFAGVALFASFKVITVDELVHATVWLSAVLFAVAGLFLVAGAPFLAMVQVLVYVGAVITLILFTIMLTIPRKETVSLDDIELPPGVTIERVEDLEPEWPRYGHGPMKSFTGTNPRKPAIPPSTLYGVALKDGEYGTEKTVRRKTQKEDEA